MTRRPGEGRGGVGWGCPSPSPPTRQLRGPGGSGGEGIGGVALEPSGKSRARTHLQMFTKPCQPAAGTPRLSAQGSWAQNWLVHGGVPGAGTQGGWPAPPRFVDGEGAPRCLACWQCSLRVQRYSKERSQARRTAHRSERPLLSHVTPAPAVQGSLFQIRLLSVFVPLHLGEQHRSVWCLH